VLLKDLNYLFLMVDFEADRLSLAGFLSFELEAFFVSFALTIFSLVTFVLGLSLLLEVEAFASFLSLPAFVLAVFAEDFVSLEEFNLEDLSRDFDLESADLSRVFLKLDFTLSFFSLVFSRFFSKRLEGFFSRSFLSFSSFSFFAFSSSFFASP